MNFNIISMLPGIVIGGIVLFVVVIARKRIVDFIKSSRIELKKVVFPTREKVIAQTKLILVSLVVMALFFGGVDLLLGQLMSFVFS
ncbi:MAG: preprotein translocase subunit SecE [Spirochaetaceae bacterium]|nr:preprotein translocase subunit SecE [Spirochaetaceae bacterium]